MKWRSLQEAGENTDLRPLREILAERKDAITKYVPAETQAIHARAIADLKEKNLAANSSFSTSSEDAGVRFAWRNSKL